MYKAYLSTPNKVSGDFGRFRMNTRYCATNLGNKCIAKSTCECLLNNIWFGPPDMANLTKETLMSRVFNDPKNYPYGFSRSGDFSINESKALMQYGCLIAALVDGKVVPESDLEHGLLAAAFEQKQPETAAEKAWVKYQQRINRPKLGNIYGGQPAQLEEAAEVSTDNALEIEIDDC